MSLICQQKSQFFLIILLHKVNSLSFHPVGDYPNSKNCRAQRDEVYRISKSMGHKVLNYL